MDLKIDYNYENDFIKYLFTQNILYVTIKKESPTDDEWQTATIEMKKFYSMIDKKDYNNDISLIFNVLNLGILPLSYYKEWGEMFNGFKEITNKTIYKTSIILNNMFIRASLNVFFKLYTPMKPLKITSSIQESLDFIAK